MRPAVAASVALAIAVVTQWPRAAAAQEASAEDRALAVALFEEGRRLVADGRFEEACPKLEASQRLDPGGGTLLNLALCHEQLGRTATAWTELIDARAVARRDGRQDRVDLAQAHIDALQPRLRTLVVRVPTELPEGFVVLRDGLPLGRDAWGVRAPVDPGVHSLKASAPGRITWNEQVDVPTTGDPIEVVVPRLEPEVTPPPAARVSPPALEPAVKPAPIGAREERLTGVGWTAIGLAVGGQTALVGGLVVGGFAWAKHGAADDAGGDCTKDCSQRAVDLEDQAGVAADVSTGLFVAAAALDVAALSVFFIGGSAVTEPVTVRAGVGPGGPGLRASVDF